MYPYLGDFAAGATIFFPFQAFNSSGASVTITGLAVTDIEVYKGASMTQRSSDAGYALVDTDGIDLDGITGLHGFTIDTSDNTDASFYAAGNDYTVVVSAVTIDSQTVSFIAGRFSIENRSALRPTTAGRTLDVSAGGEAGIDWANVGSPTTSVALSGTTIGLTTNAINSVADQVWDEASSGHVASGSFGARLFTIRSATAAGGAASYIDLDGSANATDDFYNNALLYIISGTGANQARYISDYTGSSKRATVNGNWVTSPSSDSVYVIVPAGSIPGASAPTAADVADAVWDELLSGHTVAGSAGQAITPMGNGTAQSGTTSSIVLAAGASAVVGAYRYCVVEIKSGTGAGQARQITAYDATSKAATVAPDWGTAPASDSVYVIRYLGVDAATVEAIADAVWDEARSGHVGAGSFGEYVPADMVRISGDATAADNAEAFFDGTGYAGTNNVIPQVTTVTGNVNGSVAGNVAGDVLGNVAGDVQGAVAGAVGSVTGAVGSVTGNVGGNVAGSVGSVVATVSANVVSISGDSTAADNAEAFFDGTGYAGTNNVIPTVTTVSGAVGSVTGAVGSVTAIVNADVKKINAVTVAGDGSGTPWGP